MDATRQRLYRTEAIVIRRLDIGEADKILTLYTPHHGKVRAIAKGVRRPESHIGGNVELFVRSAMLLARGRELDVVTQAETVDSFKGLRNELDRLQTAFYLAELLDALTDEALSNEPAYDLLVECLAALASNADPEVVSRYYEYRLLAQLGYLLELGECVNCRTPLAPEPNWFSPDAGGALCPRCRHTDDAALELSVNTLKVLRLIAREPLARLLRVRLPAAVRQELRVLGHASVRQRLDRDLNTWRLDASSP